MIFKNFFDSLPSVFSLPSVWHSAKASWSCDENKDMIEMKRELEVRGEFAKAVSQAVLSKQRSRGTKVGLSWRFVQVVGEIDQREIGEGQVVNRRIEPKVASAMLKFSEFLSSDMPE